MSNTKFASEKTDIDFVDCVARIPLASDSWDALSFPLQHVYRRVNSLSAIS